MSFEYYYDGVSIQNGRNTNMDSLILKTEQILNEAVVLGAVCDGVGSLESGGYAASLAVKMLDNWFCNLETTEDLGSNLKECVSNINVAITKRAAEKKLETACTLSCILLSRGHFYLVHLGDSRIYATKDMRLIQLTYDHTRNGKLTSVVGRFEDTEIFCSEGILEMQSTILLCSDGLYKRMDFDYLEKAVLNTGKKNISKTLNDLSGYVIDRGEKDNISVALITNKG